MSILTGVLSHTSHRGRYRSGLYAALSIFSLALTRHLAGVHGREARPKHDYTFDRIDNKGDYEPGNCPRPTWSEQNLSRRSRKVRKQAA